MHKGTVSYPGGETYKGSWKLEHFHGHGVQTLPNGVKYEGNFEMGVKVSLECSRRCCVLSRVRPALTVCVVSLIFILPAHDLRCGGAVRFHPLSLSFLVCAYVCVVHLCMCVVCMCASVTSLSCSLLGGQVRDDIAQGADQCALQTRPHLLPRRSAHLLL
jgi:hypothetical protein